MVALLAGMWAIWRADKFVDSPAVLLAVDWASHSVGQTADQ